MDNVLENNKGVVRRWVNELFNGGNLNVADEIIAPNATQQGEFFPMLPTGPEGYKQLVTRSRAAFGQNVRIMLDPGPFGIVAENDMVTTNWTARGTHQGPFMGRPPTGRPVAITGSDTWRLEGGKIVANRCVCDLLGLLQQIDVMHA